MSNAQRDKRLFASTVILVVIHIVGIIGIQSTYRDLFLLCTPYNLMLSIGFLFWNHIEFNKSFFIFAILTFLMGFFIEVIGIKTGMIFGQYSYGKTLGFKLMEVPLIIGINWLVLIYIVGVLCNKLPYIPSGRYLSAIFKSIFGATLLTTLDFFIEAVAIKYDFWRWANYTPPIQNFVAWFIVSFLLLLLFHSLQFNKNNKLAQGLFIIQLIFFVALSVL